MYKPTWMSELQDYRTDELADCVQYDLDLDFYSISELNDMLVAGYISPSEFERTITERELTRNGPRRA